MGTAIKHPVPDQRQSARMSKLTNDGLTRTGRHMIATVGVTQPSIQVQTLWAASFYTRIILHTEH